MAKEEDVQKKLLRFQLLQNNFQTLRKRIEAVIPKFEELQHTKQTLMEMKDLKPAKAFVPLGSGNFVEGSIGNADSIIVGIGSNVAVRKKREDAMEILDSRINELHALLGDLTEEEQKTAFELSRLEHEIQENLQENK